MRYSYSRHARAKELYDGGMSRDEIARVMRVRCGKVNGYLNYVPKENPRGRKPNGNAAKVRRMKGEGKTFQQIGDALGITRQAAHQLYYYQPVQREAH